ncbi:9677_t:CDS:2 [Funneliformis caledonium]|uniref:9677_t:CDS:1 n=2 Tax=Funneliformis TaxID=1117308 RepID=A0A9N8WLG6_9GLOM|nr:9677_t:CDS:2 [Funneliformis caledonium]CAG8613265.1 16551_t:CDS:2 [Funneliformis mosseae]
MNFGDIPDLSQDFERRGSESDTFRRPSYKEKFHAKKAKQIIQQVVSGKLDQAIYEKDQAPGWANEIAEEIKAKLLEMELSRYKYIINVTILENKKGAGARIQVNGLWDSSSDGYAQEIFKNSNTNLYFKFEFH